MLNKLKTTIEERGITRNRLAIMSGISTSDMYQIFSGKRALFPAWRKRIAEALEMPEEELFPEEGEGNDEK